MEHGEHEHLEALAVTGGEAIEGGYGLPTTRALVIVSEPCGCYVIRCNGFTGPDDLIMHLMHVAKFTAREAGGDVLVEAIPLSSIEPPSASGPAS